MLLGSGVIVVGVFVVGGAFADESGPDLAPSDEPTITTLFGEEPAGLGGRMTAAADAGPSSLSCEPGEGEALTCVAVGDEEALAALKRGETLHGRNVMGFRGGATTADNSIPVFESTALVCHESAEGSISCMPMTAEAPTAVVGQDTFVYYVQQKDVLFTESGTSISRIGDLTIPLVVVAE